MTTMTRMTRMRTRKKSSVALVLGFALASASWASSASEDVRKPYALLVGTVYGPDDRPVYGVKVVIHPAGHSKPKWEAISDHHGEFAQRLPIGPGDYVVNTDFKRSKSVPFGSAPEAKVH